MSECALSSSPLASPGDRARANSLLAMASPKWPSMYCALPRASQYFVERGLPSSSDSKTLAHFSYSPMPK